MAMTTGMNLLPIQNYLYKVSLQKLFVDTGTTWTQELVWLLANDLDYIKAAETSLFHRYPFLDLFQIFDSNQIENIVKTDNSNVDKQQLRDVYTLLAQPVTSLLETMPSPRFVKTHLPMSLLNPKLLDTAKLVYIARDPRDVAVSCYHHAQLLKLTAFLGEFKEFWNLFYKGLYVFCPILEHVKEAWAMRHHPNMLFLFYEELSKHFPVMTTNVDGLLNAKYISLPVIMKQCPSIRNIGKINIKCEAIKFVKGKSVAKTKSTRRYLAKGGNRNISRIIDIINSVLGKAGGWRDYFDEEMAEQAEQWIKDSLLDTDLRYPQTN